MTKKKPKSTFKSTTMERIYLDNNATTFSRRMSSKSCSNRSNAAGKPRHQHQFWSGRSSMPRSSNRCLADSVNAMRHGNYARSITVQFGRNRSEQSCGLGFANRYQGFHLGPVRLKHPSILAACEAAQKRGRPVEYIPCLGKRHHRFELVK